MKLRKRRTTFLLYCKTTWYLDATNTHCAKITRAELFWFRQGPPVMSLRYRS